MKSSVDFSANESHSMNDPPFTPANDWKRISKDSSFISYRCITFVFSFDLMLMSIFKQNDEETVLLSSSNRSYLSSVPHVSIQ